MCSVPTSPPLPRDAAGFTLIEVLIAMVVLAVGLLGLEALGIGASRAVNRAERTSSYAFVASDTLERTLSRIRRGDVVADGTTRGVVRPSDTERRYQDSLRITVSTTPIPATTTTPARVLRTVSVTIVPDPSSKLLTRRDSLRLLGNVFRN